jgi:hypothetical protein
MAFQSEMRRARQAAGIAGCRPTLGKTLEAPFPSAHQGFPVESKAGNWLACIPWAAFRSSRRGRPRYGRDWMMLREQQPEL